MNAQQMINALVAVEMGVPKVEPDCRRLMIQERFALEAAVKSGDAAAIKRAMDETARTAALWGVEL